MANERILFLSSVEISLGTAFDIQIQYNKMSTKKELDHGKLVHSMYHKIAAWHNNDERLSDAELGRELKFLCLELVQDTLVAVFGEGVLSDVSSGEEEGGDELTKEEN